MEAGIAASGEVGGKSGESRGKVGGKSGVSRVP
jgi:hypothetical protein